MTARGHRVHARWTRASSRRHRGWPQREGHEVATLTCSMLEILLDLSSYVEVRPAHLAEQPATPGRVRRLDQGLTSAGPSDR